MTRIIFRGEMNSSTLYILLCIFLKSVNFVPTIQKEEIDYGLVYALHSFGRGFP